jgi:DNA-binding transcriptional MerR regulator
VRLQLILRGKRLGFTLTEIAHVLDLYDDQPGERGQLEYLISESNSAATPCRPKRRDLDEALAELDALEQRCRERSRAVADPSTLRDHSRASEETASCCPVTSHR